MLNLESFSSDNLIIQMSIDFNPIARKLSMTLTNIFNLLHAIRERHQSYHKNDLMIVSRYLRNEIPNDNFTYCVRFEIFCILS